MRTKDYIDATYDLVKAGNDEGETLTKLKSYLNRRGLHKLYPAVLRGLMEKSRRSMKTGRVKVFVARKEDTDTHQGAIEEALKAIQGNGHDVIVDESIIGGFIVKGKNERLDQSFKNRLLHVYHRLTD